MIKKNMILPSNEKVAELRAKYLPGTRIKFLYGMVGDPNPVKPGAYGSVTSVDDAGHIHMIWDDHGTLSLIEAEDHFVIVTMTLEEFVATRKEVACVEKELFNATDNEEKPGYIYLEGFNIEKCKTGGFLLILGSDQFQSENLSELEKILYDAHFYY